MPRLKRADALRRKDQFLLVCANGKTIATIQGVEEGLTERDLAPPKLARFASDAPLVGLRLLLSRPVAVPDVPGWKAQLWMLWARPDDLFEPYV